MILLEDINSYPEMCAEHVLSRSTSTPPIPVSAFFTAFFHSRARASSTGRAVTPSLYWNMGISDSAVSLIITE